MCSALHMISYCPRISVELFSCLFMYVCACFLNHIEFECFHYRKFVPGHT